MRELPMWISVLKKAVFIKHVDGKTDIKIKKVFINDICVKVEYRFEKMHYSINYDIEQAKKLNLIN